METHQNQSGLLTLSKIIPLVKEGSVIFIDLDDTLILDNLVTGKRERVEEGVTEILDEMRNKGGLVIACSARSFSSLERIEKHLEEASIKLKDKNLKFIEPFFMNESRTAGFARGILCCPHFAVDHSDVFDKASGIAHFVDMLEVKYCRQVTRVIFVDDVESTVQMVHRKLSLQERESWTFQYQAGLNKSAQLASLHNGYEDIVFEKADFVNPNPNPSGFFETLKNMFI